jgi:ATP-binding cassette subfamily B protein
MKTLTRKTLSIFWQHARRYPWAIVVVVLGVLIVTAIQTYTPLLYKDLIDLLTLSKPGDGIDSAVRIIIMIFVIQMARMLLWRVVSAVNIFFESKTMKNLTDTCYEHLAKHSYGFFTSKFVGSLVTKVKRYERSYETIADQIAFNLGRTILDMGFVLTVLIWQYRELSYSVIWWCAFFMAFTYVSTRFKMPYDLRRSEADTRTTAQMADSITNNVNIKLFASYGYENKRFEDVTESQHRLRKKSWDLGNILDMVQATSMILLEFWMIYLAIKLWDQGKLTIGDLVLVQTYLFRLFDKLWDMGQNIRAIYGAIADANEMTEILTSPHEVQDAAAAKKLKVRKGKIEFKNVSFGYYQETPILQDFDLEIAAGERLALIGPSGGGKSTIVKTMFRFHDIQSGQILIDGQDISKVTQDSLRASMSLVPQEPILFHRSLMDNIRYARPKASDKEVIRAAKMAHADEFISSFREGYDTLVGERGIKLSGGERQRVAIARAILKDAPILVLDEATSSLDSESEMYIQDALKKLMKGRTTIVVAHRLSTIMQMDRIVVIGNGKVLEQGRHDELLKVKKGMYQKLWGIQAGGFASLKTEAI